MISQVVCAFVPYECRSIIEASVVRFGSDWAAIMVFDMLLYLC